MKSGFQYEGLIINKVSDNKYSLKLDDHFSNIRGFILDVFSLYEIETKAKKTDEITFTTSSLQPLSTYLQKNKKLNYNQTVTLAHQMKLFVDFAENSQKTIVSFDLDDVLVFDKKNFLFMNYSKMVPLQNKLAKVNSLGKDEFASLEAQALKSVPGEISFKSCYFSLGLMLIYCIFNEKLDTSKSYDLKEKLHLIYDTPLYWFIVQSLQKDLEKRSLIFM